MAISAGRNHPGATNEECLAALREYQSQKRRCDEETGVLRSIIKRAKGIGVPVKAMLQTAAAQRLDPEEVKQNLRDQVRMMSLTRMPIIQTDLFPELDDIHVTEKARESDDLWSAQEEGYRAGRNGVPTDENPYVAGTELFAGWESAWRNGKDAVDREMGERGSQASGARKRAARAPRDGDDVETLSVRKAPRKAGGQTVPGAKRKAGRPRKAASAQNGGQAGRSADNGSGDTAGLL